MALFWSEGVQSSEFILKPVLEKVGRDSYV